MTDFSSWLVLLVFSFGNVHHLAAQVVIWAEDFSSYSDGSTQGSDLNQANPADDWISWGCLACADSLDDWWEVRSEIVEAHDVNTPVFWRTEAIPIANYQNVEFSMDLKEIGDLEGFYFGSDDCVDQANQDYVNVSYRLDGGPWNLVSNYLNWCGLYDECGSHTLYGDDGEASGDCRTSDVDFDSVRLVKTGLTGDSLEIQVELINSADDEYLQIDNIEVSGTLLLPVVWRSFIAQLYHNQVKLLWETASERNARTFQILYCQGDPNNKDHWVLLDSVQAAGHSDEVQTYEFTDRVAFPGTHYYRLNQVDFDEKHNLSSIVAVHLEEKLSIWPNPAVDHLNIHWSGNWCPQQLHGTISNALGQIVYEKMIKNSTRVDLTALPRGWYIFRYMLGSETDSRLIWVIN